MRTKSVFSAALILIVGCSFLMAKNFWEKPFREWKKDEAFKMKDNSPWAKIQTMAAGTSRRGDAYERTSDAGRSETYSSVTVRLFSALPVREAYVRIMQLMNNYDAKSEAEKAAIDERFSVALKRDFSKMVVVELDYAGNDPNAQRDVKTFLLQAKPEQLKQNCYLISNRLGRVEIQEYYPPSADGSAAKLVFPRIVKDQPIVTPEDKELTFDMWLEPIQQKVFVRFKVKDLMYGGHLEY